MKFKNLIKSMTSTFNKRKNYDGIVITPAGRDELWYIDGDHKINVFTELSHGNIDRIIVKDSIKVWENPYEKELITEEQKTKILRLVSKYFEDIGETYLIE